MSASFSDDARARVASMQRFVSERGLTLAGEPTLRWHEEHVIAARFPALELRFHFAGSTHAVYRRSGALGISYVGAADIRVVDAVCEWVAKNDRAFADALERVGKGASTFAEEAAPKALAVPPSLVAALAPLALTELHLVRSAEKTIELRAVAGERQLRLELRPLLAARNPYLAGGALSIILPEVVLPGPGAEAVERIAAAVVSLEDELVRLFEDPGHVVRMKMFTGRSTILPVGKLVRFLDGALRDVCGLIYLTSPCYANCVFCGEETTRDYVLSEVDEVLRSIRQRDFQPQRVAIGGFEPLSHPGILEMIATLRETGVDRVELMTTGIPLGNLRFVDALVDAGLTDVAVPIYGVDATTNDLVMRKSGAFAATLAGLDHLRDRGCVIRLHSIAVQQNVTQLDAMAELARTRWNASFVAAPPRAKQKHHASIAARTEQLAAVSVAPLLGVPFCLHPRMAEHPDVRVDAPLQLTLVGIADSMRFYFSQEQVQLPDCARCVYRTACTGVMAAQLEIEPSLRVIPFES